MINCNSSFTLEKDETEIEVLSSLGQHMGNFAWPTMHLDMLEYLNDFPRGCYFAWRLEGQKEGYSSSPKRNTIERVLKVT